MRAVSISVLRLLGRFFYLAVFERSHPEHLADGTEQQVPVVIYKFPKDLPGKDQAVQSVARFCFPVQEPLRTKMDKYVRPERLL